MKQVTTSLIGKILGLVLLVVGTWYAATHQDKLKSLFSQTASDANLIAQTETPTAKTEAPLVAATTIRVPGAEEESWVYQDNEARREINAEGLGRCYDIRYIDPINWSNESLKSGQRASAIDLVRDNTRRPARHNDKDYVVPKGVVFTSEIIGDSEAESKFASTAYEFENEVLESYEVEAEVPRKGSAKISAAFHDVSSSSSSNSSLYAFSKMYKQYYKLDLYFDDPAHQHYINQRFWQGVKELNDELSANQFIEKFGTHYASTTYYGGNFFQRRTVNQSAYAYYESNEKGFKADVAGTVKKVDFEVGTVQNQKNQAGETERVAMSAAKIYTVGGDLNQHSPDLWSESVLKNLAVVKVKLTRLSDLLMTKNFPTITDISAKKAILEAAILKVEQEAAANESDLQKHSFFTKKSAKFKLTVTHIKCKKHGKKESGENSEYYGKLTMGMFNENGKSLKRSTFFNKDSKKIIKLGKNQSYDLNKSITYTVKPNDIENGFVSVYGHLNEKDMVEIKLSKFSKHETTAKIKYQSALDNEVKKILTFTSSYGDKVEVHYVLRKIG